MDIAQVRTTARELHSEATAILSGGVLALLEQEFTGVELAGSVSLDVMAVPDVDVFCRLEADEANKLFALTTKLATQLERQGYALAKATINNEHVLPDPNFPTSPGLYGGFVFVNVRSGRKWKLDFWGWDRRWYDERRSSHHALHQRLERANRDLILWLKSLDGYGQSFFSMDVYEFALSGSGDSLEAFQYFLSARKSKLQ